MNTKAQKILQYALTIWLVSSSARIQAQVCLTTESCFYPNFMLPFLSVVWDLSVKFISKCQLAHEEYRKKSKSGGGGGRGDAAVAIPFDIQLFPDSASE